MPVANKGTYDLETHINIAKHKKQIVSCQFTPKASEFFIKQNSRTERVIVTEGAL
jgi:hypothetical protein